jgi:uncharacterized membrane protein YczE
MISQKTTLAGQSIFFVAGIFLAGLAVSFCVMKYGTLERTVTQ